MVPIVFFYLNLIIIFDKIESRCIILFLFKSYLQDLVNQDLPSGRGMWQGSRCIPFQYMVFVVHSVNSRWTLSKYTCIDLSKWLCGFSSERRPKKKVDGDKSDSSGSFNTSENEDRKKDDIHSSSDEKDDGEAKVWTVQSISLAYRSSCLRIPGPLLYVYVCSAAETNCTGYESIAWR